MPRCSVIMSAYNCGSYIDAAIGSVIAQTESDFELIVIDDGSIDDTLVRAKVWADLDSRVHVITQPNSGRPGATRNAGLECATGKYVAFLDGDDFYHPDRLNRAVRVLEATPEIQVLFHNMYTFHDTGEEDTHTYPSLESYLDDPSFVPAAQDYLLALDDELYLCSDRFFVFMAINFAGLHTNTVIVRRTELERHHLRFAEDITVGEDTELWYRLAQSLRIGYLDQKLSYYRQHAAGVTRNRERWLRDLRTVYIRNYNATAVRMTAQERAAVRNRISKHCFSEAYFEWTRAHAGLARRAYWRSVRWRINVKALVAVLKTFVPRTLA
jgi:glycosyltransferase involved in cell wall biosynthesis